VLLPHALPVLDQGTGRCLLNRELGRTVSRTKAVARRSFYFTPRLTSRGLMVLITPERIINVLLRFVGCPGDSICEAPARLAAGEAAR
jgi:hypothetical protein